MRVATVALFLGGVAVFMGSLGLSQGPKDERNLTALKPRIEVDEHEHCFTVRFFLKNDGKDEEKVEYGRGGSGLQVVPQFRVDFVTITPPTYVSPPRRSMKPDVRSIPAGEEILYGTFTMGYPVLDQGGDKKLTASIYFRELKATLRTEPQPLKIPAPKRPE